MLPQVRVVVRVPGSRPENPLEDPAPIEWTPEKADLLWKVIEKSRTSDNSGTDWKGLAAHLEVPLPYLLYRVHARFQEELRGLQDIPGVLSPSRSQPPPAPLAVPDSPIETIVTRATRRLSMSTRLSPAGRLSTPMGIRARLSSLGQSSRPRKAASSSTLTVQPRSPRLQRQGSASSEDTDSEEEDNIKEEEAERVAEEQEALDRKLQDLQRMMTNDTLGLVSTRTRNKGKGPAQQNERGRVSSSIVSPASSHHRFDHETTSRSTSRSFSSASSPQGSIPDIPSPLNDSLPQSPIGRHISPNKSSSPPALSPRNALGHSHRKYGHLRSGSEKSSSQDSRSEASSFSDISDASLSASALESALMSNTRGTGSRFSHFTKSRFGGRAGAGTH